MVTIKALSKIHLNQLLHLEDKDIEKYFISYIIDKLSTYPKDYLIQIDSNFAILNKHSHLKPPKQRGMYLKLFNGRKIFGESADHWGEDGPWIGPLKSFYSSYTDSMTLVFSDGDMLEDMQHSLDFPQPIFFYQDTLFTHDLYFTDWELEVLP